jgi:hypothetical protein
MLGHCRKACGACDSTLPLSAAAAHLHAHPFADIVTQLLAKVGTCHALLSPHSRWRCIVVCSRAVFPQALMHLLHPQEHLVRNSAVHLIACVLIECCVACHQRMWRDAGAPEQRRADAERRLGHSGPWRRDSSSCCHSAAARLPTHRLGTGACKCIWVARQATHLREKSPTALCSRSWQELLVHFDCTFSRQSKSVVCLSYASRQFSFPVCWFR